MRHRILPILGLLLAAAFALLAIAPDADAAVQSYTGNVINITTDPETGDRLLDIDDGTGQGPIWVLVGPDDGEPDAISDSYENGTEYVWEYEDTTQQLVSVSKP